MMKTYTKLGTFFTLLVTIILTISVGALAPATSFAAGKPPTATPTTGGGPTATPGSPTATPGANQPITVSGTQWGVSTCFIGATEGSSGFNNADLTDLGINTYRIWGGVSRWEPVDDDGVYGSPSIAQIKANLNVIPWSVWDNIMTNPPNGTDYNWALTRTGSDLNLAWHGNARTIFSTLQTDGIRPVVTLRNSDNYGNSTWAPNPPKTTADWNEWWEHVFATVYWLNVRNDYHVDDYEVHNEPNNRRQGWSGTEADYYAFVQQTSHAIKYVYATYLPGRTPHIYAPVTTYNSTWPSDVMLNDAGAFDSVDIHDYDYDMSGSLEQVHASMNADGFATAPLWVSEWATYASNRYADPNFGPGGIVLNLIRQSRPGNDYVTGSHLFSLYNWTTYISGLINQDGTREPDYYAFRLGLRALQGCRPTYQSTTAHPDLNAITTKDALGHVYLLVTNVPTNQQGTPVTYSVDANLSALLTSGTGTLWQYDATHLDVVVGSPTLSNGHVIFSIPGNAVMLIKF